MIDYARYFHFMTTKNHESKSRRLGENDVCRAESKTGGKAPLKTSEEDVYVPDTELTYDEASDEDKNRNDPTGGKSSPT